MRTWARAGLKDYRGDLAALLAGGILPLAFAPFFLYPLALLSLLVLFISWQGVTPRQAFRRGFLFGLGLFGVGVSWVFVAIHEFGQASPLLAGLMTFGFVALLAMILAVWGWGIKKITGPEFSATDYILLLPVGWLAFEWFKAWFLTGFPWLEVGTTQIDGPLAGMVPIIGINGISWLVALMAGLLAAALVLKKYWPVLVTVGLLLTSLALQPFNWTQPVSEPFKATLIQGNVDQAIKWDRQQLRNTLQLYQQLTLDNLDADLVVWPENAATAFYHQIEAGYLDPLADKVASENTDVLLGLPVADEDSDAYYNSMAVIGESRGFYHKRHLVPFGDYVPLDSLRGLIAFFDLPMSGFRPGPQQQPLLQAAGQPVGISICYEDAFSDEVLSTLPEATYLVNATNNAWYGDSFAPHQHLQISRSRALETGRSVVRSTTNGISALIDHKGRIQSQTPQFERAVLSGEVQPRQGQTPYAATAPWLMWLLVSILLGLWWWLRASGERR